MDVVPSEPRLDVATPFEELKRHLEAKGVVHVSAVEEFLTMLKEKPSITSKMLQELMVLFSGSVPPLLFFILYIHDTFIL